MSGLYFWWTSQSLFRTFLENYQVSLFNEKTTTCITLRAYAHETKIFSKN